MDLESIYKIIVGHPVTTDTRNLSEGDVFFALKGDRFDGNAFAEKALEKGAHAVITERKDLCSDKTIAVEDGLKTLQDIASLHRHRLGIPILGITGTNGKTTTKELCCAVLGKKFRTIATKGNLNNHIGVPLTLLSMDQNTEFGIVEMGASHPGEIEFLCNISDPDFGLLTNIGEAHLEGFGDMDHIIETKTALYRHVSRKQGTLFVNTDDPLLEKLSQDCKRHSYGSKNADTCGTMAQGIPYMVADLDTAHGHLYIETALVGGYNFYNAMAAIAVGEHFGIGSEEISKAIRSYRPGNMRSQLIRKEKNTIILDAYNANPSSMNTALENFSGMKGKDKVVILGEMLELGTMTREAHRKITELAQDKHFSKMFLIGEPFREFVPESENNRWFPDTETLINFLKENELKNFLIFVKGSRKNRLERIVEYL